MIKHFFTVSFSIDNNPIVVASISIGYISVEYFVTKTILPIKLNTTRVIKNNPALINSKFNILFFIKTDFINVYIPITVGVNPKIINT